MIGSKSNAMSKPTPAPVSDGARARSQLAQLIADPFFSEALFDALRDVVFFVKDLEGKYVAINQSLVERCGFRSKEAMLGKTALEVFPSRFGVHYMQQDQSVIKSGKNLSDHLELHLYPGRDPGWCLTSKWPLRDRMGNIVGLTGVSRDLQAPERTHASYQKVADAAHHIQEHFDRELRMSELARIAGMSVSQLERYFHKLYLLTPRQMLLRARLDAASAMLLRDISVTDVALACGYQDHSAFTRQFKATVGMTPSAYRKLTKP